MEVALITFYQAIIIIWSLLVLAPSSSWAQSIVAAVLPSSRSVQVGTPATAFATIINSGSVTATSCGISLVTAIPATFSFQTTNPLTNQVTGSPNTPVDIPPGVAQSFVFALTSSSPINPIDVQFSFDCTNTNPAPVNTGLNTLLFSASSTPVPDIVALTATLNNNGIVDVASTGVFSVATVNVGATGVITASADTGEATLPIAISICQTNPSNGQCVSAMAPSVTIQINAGATPTFGIFVQGNGNVPFDPAGNRVFVRFKDGSGITRGSTSVAVRAQNPPDIRGTYNGSGSLTQSSCQQPQNNGTFGFSASVNIPSQTGATFSGTATLTTIVSGINFVTNINLPGTVTAGGQLSGTFTFTTFANGAFDASGNGTFAGFAAGNTLTLNFSGKILVGESCTITGNASATR
jgi:hypothetical protein